MEIMIVGGQYDGEWVTVGNDPLPYINMYPKLEPLTAALKRDINPNSAVDVLVYKLEMVWLSPQKRHYEYHYQEKGTC